MHGTRAGFLFLLLVLIPGARAGIYKWTDENGQVHYTDTPPQGREQRLEITGSISSYTSPEIVATEGSESEAVEKARPPGNRRVIMYSAPWCGVCKTAKKYFTANKIPFTEYDIDNNPKARTDFDRMGGRGVPVILVGRHRMNGFSPGGFEQLYYGR